MSKLSLFLPPFAADYSGACAVLFPFDCMVVILDAGCCTRNYAEYDEPRWTSERKPAFSAQIRTLDTVMGDEAGIVEQVAKAASELDPACIALVGTPVPAIVGMDLSGMAADVRHACGIPCLGIATNGFDTYERGVSRALQALVEAFAVPTVSTAVAPEAGGKGARRDGPLRASLLGATPLDLPDPAAVDRWKALLRARGIEVGFDGLSPFGVAEAAALGRADVSIVVSQGGLAAARLLRDRAQVPFVVGAPLNGFLADALASAARRAVADGGPVRPARNAGMGDGGLDGPKRPRALLVGDQVLTGSLRAALLKGGGLAPQDLAVATFFARDAALSQAGDFAIGEDSQLEEYVRKHPDVVVVGDPLLWRLPSLAGDRLVELVHPAVSGRLFSAAATGVDALLEEIRRRVEAASDSRQGAEA